MPHYTALVTLLAILFYFYTGVRVPRARSKFGLTAPAMTGPPEFERRPAQHAGVDADLPAADVAVRLLR